jgi:hypothetical protein
MHGCDKETRMWPALHKYIPAERASPGASERSVWQMHPLPSKRPFLRGWACGRKCQRGQVRVREGPVCNVEVVHGGTVTLV